MKNISPYHIYDIERLLLRKKMAELNETEKAFLLTHFQNYEQIKAYRKMLLQMSNVMNVEEETEILPAPFLQQKLRQKMAQKQKVYRNDIFASVAAIIQLFAMRHQAHSGLIAAMLLVFCWFGGNFDTAIIYNNTAEDTLAMQYIDTLHKTTYLADNQDSSTIHFEQNMNANRLFVDSFQVNGILRK